MAKKAAGTPKQPKPAGATIRESEVMCPRRGCGRVHRVCLEATKTPGGEDWLTYQCPTTNQVAGVRFGDLAWHTVTACADGSIPIYPPAE